MKMISIKSIFTEFLFYVFILGLLFIGFRPVKVVEKEIILPGKDNQIEIDSLKNELQSKLDSIDKMRKEYDSIGIKMQKDRIEFEKKLSEMHSKEFSPDSLSYIISQELSRMQW